MNNVFRFLTPLPVRIVRLNNYIRIALLFILFAGLANKGFGQTGTGTCGDPIVIDLTGQPNASFTRAGDTRSGQCCTIGGNSTTCVSYKIILDPATDVLSISLPPNGKKSNSEGYYVDCDGPYDINTPVCLNGRDKNYVIVSYCKPGNDLSTGLVFTTSSGFTVSSNISLRPGCTGTLSVTGLIPSTIKWTSIAPGNPGDYNSYLSQPSAGQSTVTVTPPAVAPGAGYVDYQVTGIEQSPCNTVTKTGVIRVYFYPTLTASISSSAPTVCSGNPVTLTATASGGNPGDPNNPSYTYYWTNTGATTPSITVNAPGTYTVQINDLLTGCGVASKSITIGATTVVPPTVPTVTVCTGQQPTLTATGPGGPYQWINSAGSVVSTSDTYSPTGLGPGTYYYTVVTSYGGCPSPSTTAILNIVAPPPAPTAASQTICNGSSATLTASAAGGPYQYAWYNAAGNLVGSGASFNTGILTNGTTGNYTFLYTVVASNGICSGPPTPVTVTVLPTPPGPTAPPVTACTGQPATLAATAGASYQWYDPSGNLIPGATGASYTVSGLAPGPYTYYVTTVGSGGCTSALTPVTLTVLATPPGPTAPPVTICSGQQATLQASLPGGPYQWYDPSGTPVGNGGSTYQTVTLTTGATNTIYPYTVTSSNGGCVSQTTTVPVTVTPLPPTPGIQAQ